MRQFSSFLPLLALLIPACGAPTGNSQGVRQRPGVRRTLPSDEPTVVRSFVTLHDHRTFERSIMNFAAGWQVKPPLDAAGPSEDMDAYVSQMAALKLGDLSFGHGERQVLISWCRRIMPLGPGLLNHLPAEIAPKFDGTAVVPVRLGDRFLVGTVNGNYALVRAAQRVGRDLVVEYIHQPNGTTVFPKTNVLEGKLREHFAAREASSFVHALRQAGVEVCFEECPRRRRMPPLWQRTGEYQTVQAALADYTKGNGRDYTWRTIADDSVIVLYPRDHPVLLTPVEPELAREFTGSWIELVRKCTAETAIHFPPGPPVWRRSGVAMGPVSELPPDQEVRIDLTDAKCLLDVFDRLCAATGMYFGMHYTGDPKVLQLEWGLDQP